MLLVHTPLLLTLVTLNCIFFFFFQAEDGIRDHCVTGVQTCALPISAAWSVAPNAPPAAVIRMITPALMRDVSTISASAARLAPRCRAYTHMATPADTSSARLAFPMIAV